MTIKNRRDRRSGPKSYWMSAEAFQAEAELSLALDLPKTKVLELALIRLREEWRSGALRGIKLDIQPPRVHADQS